MRRALGLEIKDYLNSEDIHLLICNQLVTIRYNQFSLLL